MSKNELHKAPKVFCYLSFVVIFFQFIGFLIYIEDTYDNGGFLVTLNILIAFLSIIPYYLILRMEKKGFYLLVIISIVVFIATMIMSDFKEFPIRYFIGPVILFGLLQIGEENSSWKRMK